ATALRGPDQSAVNRMGRSPSVPLRLSELASGTTAPASCRSAGSSTCPPPVGDTVKSREVPSISPDRAPLRAGRSSVAPASAKGSPSSSTYMPDGPASTTRSWLPDRPVRLHGSLGSSKEARSWAPRVPSGVVAGPAWTLVYVTWPLQSRPLGPRTTALLGTVSPALTPPPASASRVGSMSRSAVRVSGARSRKPDTPAGPDRQERPDSAHTRTLLPTP